MKYNTQQKRLPLPEYGRSIQNMVDYALTLDDRQERQRCANTIIAVMGNMFPQLRDVQDYKHKLWDHLAIMADYKLDIDYPCEILPSESLHRGPDRVPYSKGTIRYRHYGRYINNLIQKACEMPDGPLRDQLVRLIAMQMKKEYLIWNKDGVEDHRIFEDIREYSNGQITVNEELVQLAALRAPQPPQKQPQRNNNQRRKNKKRY